MPALSWNEIQSHAIAFSRVWEGASRERAEAQSFWNDFFEIFGIRRRSVAVFEEPVHKLKGTWGFIDLFWKGTLLAEHKSAGKSFDTAQSQAFAYIQELINAERRDEVPRYVILSDFQRFALYDLEPEKNENAPHFENIRYELFEFTLPDLHKNIRRFAFIPGYKVQRLHEEDPANLKAAAIMAALHDALKAGGYYGSHLERMLVRLLFCVFADDTGIFEPAQFEAFIENRTRKDGSDLGSQLAHLFEVLNTPEDQRQKGLDQDFADFPYVNGDLFAENIRFADFNRDMRNRLQAACRFDWSRISPAIFGTLFQSVMEPAERRQIGGHYTSERNILKVIRPLFLDELEKEFNRAKKRGKAALRRFHDKLASLKFLDPACGCGNFLVIAYRELRLMEIEILKALYGKQTELALEKLSKLDVDQFYGTEIEEWPARIAETALWLTDHQMNIRLSEAFGQLYKRLPLRKSPSIWHFNALRFDWNDLLPAAECSYVFGNPPFVGKHLMTPEQKRDVQRIWGETNGGGALDYVACWYSKAADYSETNPALPCAFVSTNSISQGEQVAYLWNYLFKRGMKIHFAHRTFPWESEAKGKAHVHVVIIGFGRREKNGKKIYDYARNGEEPKVLPATNISPYLVEGPNLAVTPRSRPLCEVPATIYGNKPADGGHLIIDPEERRLVEQRHPELLKYIRPLICAQEYLQGGLRWCLWLKDAGLSKLRNNPYIKEKLKAVKKFRESSKKGPTREQASVPYLFAEIRQPESEYIVIPRHSSEQRKYIPFGYFTPDTIVHDSCTALPDATPYHFGVLSSAMHMAWVRQVCGRLESRYRYSAKLVYNNFPWPEKVTEKKQTAVVEKAKAVLAIREKYISSGSTLADIYDPLCTPADLLKAHQALDRAVDQCYRRQKFADERQRLEHLFPLYEKLTAPLLPANKPKRRRSPQKPRNGA